MPESSNFLYTMRTTKCITVNKTNMLKFIFAFFFYFSFFIAPAYSKVRYRGSTFRPFVRSFVRSFVRPSVRPSVHNLCLGDYSVAVIAGSMKPCIVITLDTHFKKAP